MEKQIIEKVKVSAVCDQDSPKFERMEGKEQHCYTSITKTCQTQRTSLEISTYPSPSNWKLFIFPQPHDFNFLVDFSTSNLHSTTSFRCQNISSTSGIRVFVSFSICNVYIDIDTSILKFQLIIY